MKFKTNTYQNNGSNSTIENSDKTKTNIGLCFSGGGSRALTCAWGQMLGLSTLELMDKARYISSVSGGTWATSIYSYLPEGILDTDLLGTYCPPGKLSLKNGGDHFNVNTLTDYSLGNAPAGMHLEKLAILAGLFLATNKASNHKWFWAYLVGHLVLEPYHLRSKGKYEWDSTKFFSLSKEYADKSFPSDAPPKDDFYFLRSGRPFHIMNNNIMIEVDNPSSIKSNIVQLPNQVTPVAGGARGKSPYGNINGGGLVESYGVCSTLNQQSGTTSPVDIKITQPYSLIDIVSTSSAFFAETVASYVKEQMTDPAKKQSLISQIESQLSTNHHKSLLTEIKDDIKDIAGAIEKRLEEAVLNDVSRFGTIVPSYNYWPIEKVSTNREMEYTDGGTLDNTGVIGMLAQTEMGEGKNEPIRLVVFDNTDTPLEKKNGRIIVASQIAPLFGIDFNEDTGTYQAFTADQKDPKNTDFLAQSLTSVFGNEGSVGKTPFDTLVNGLYAASCGSTSKDSPDDTKVCNDPAFYEMDLETVQNDLVGITSKRKVKLLYIQNTKILNWQNNIGDAALKAEIVKGQNGGGNGIAFKGFPYYNTFFKIGLEAKESNTLSQMWAWAISDESSPLKKKLQEFMN